VPQDQRARDIQLEKMRRPLSVGFPTTFVIARTAAPDPERTLIAA